MDVLTKDEGRVRIITLNRPEVRNALSGELRLELSRAFTEAEGDEAIRAVVLTGAGKAFCAGLDLSELKSISSRSAEENLADSRALADLFKQIYTFPKPVIAALNGAAVAGGAGLASVCDFAVMSEDAKLGYTEARIGFVAALVAAFLLRQVGERTARDLLLSARLVNAQEALNMGLVNELRPTEKVLERGQGLAQALSQNAPSSLAATKTLLATLPSLSLEEGFQHAAEVNAQARTTDDLREGVTAFLEKREPRWHN